MSRTDIDDVHLRAATCAGGLSAEAGYGCKEAGRELLGERRQGWEGRVQSRHLDAPGPQAAKASQVLRATYHDDLGQKYLLISPQSIEEATTTQRYHMLGLSSAHLGPRPGTNHVSRGVDSSRALSTNPFHIHSLIRLVLTTLTTPFLPPIPSQTTTPWSSTFPPGASSPAS